MVYLIVSYFWRLSCTLNPGELPSKGNGYLNVTEISPSSFIGSLYKARRSKVKNHKSTEASLVYSSEHGRMCPECSRPVTGCICRKNRVTPSGDGVVRIRRETKGRGGKTVTVVSGVPLGSEGIKALAGELKRHCGAGGALKDGVIEIQGDHCGAVIQELERRGFRVKRAGG